MTTRPKQPLIPPMVKGRGYDSNPIAAEFLYFRQAMGQIEQAAESNSKDLERHFTEGRALFDAMAQKVMRVHSAKAGG